MKHQPPTSDLVKRAFLLVAQVPKGRYATYNAPWVFISGNLGNGIQVKMARAVAKNQYGLIPGHKVLA